MATKIIPKKSSVADKVPLATDLEVGEIAINLADKKFYSKASDNSIVEIGGAASSLSANEVRDLVEVATDSNTFTDADHTKLNNIEAGATGDQTAAEIRVLVEAATNSNVFTDADHTKLNGIEAGATADQTAAEIKTAYESNLNTNAYTDAEKTKLTGIATGAQVNVATNLGYTTAATTGTVTSSTGTNATLPAATTTLAGLLTGADKAKLNSIETGATADQTAAEIRALVEAATDSNVFTNADHTKLNGIETGANVTDTANVTAAGALMDSEVTNLAQVKAFDSADYATAAQGTLANTATQPGDNVSTLTNDSGYITNNQTITLSGDVTGSGTNSIVVTIADDSHNHVISNVDGLQTALNGKLATTANAVSASKLLTARTISLAGDISGSTTFDGTGNVTITAAVADDSHNHVIANVDGLQTALNNKLNTSLKGAANGLAELDAAGKVPSSQLPSYVDDVLEFASEINFPATGEAGKLYVALDNNDVYRWTGTAYVKVSDAVSSADQATKLATARNIALSGDVTGSANFDGSANISITATVADDSHNHIIANVDGLQTALNGKLSTIGKAADSELLDGLDSTAFYLATNPSGYTTNTGTVTSVAATAGTGISVTGSPITSSGTLNITNTAPHIATNLGITGTGNTRTITSSTGANVTVPVATTTTAGLMALGDKSKLDGIAAGAQVNVATNLGYTTASTTGTVTSSTGANATLPAATTTLAGLMTNADKTKLNGIATGAQVNVATNLTYSTATTTGTVNSSTGANATIPAATTALAGLMTNADKTKLNSIASGAQVNVATNLSYTSASTTGTVNSSTGTNVTLPAATTTVAGLLTGADKNKLNGIASGAQVNVGTNLGSSGTGATRTITSSTGSNTSITYSASDLGAFPANNIPSGTKMLFAQTTAPTGWTKDTTHNNKALRVVSGTAGSGGSQAFTTAFGNRTTSSTATGGTVGSTTATNNAATAGGTVAAHTLSIAQMPSHGHGIQGQVVDGSGPPGGANPQASAGNRFRTTSAAPNGGGGSHAHGFTGASHNHSQNSHTHTFSGSSHSHGLDMQVQYVDIIIATKA